MTRTTIHSDYIPDNAITGVKIAENSITAREIATNAITTLYVADDSVTADKLANSINTDIATGVAALPRAGGTMTGNLVVQSDGGNEQFVIKRNSAQNEQLILGFHSSDYATIQSIEQGVAYRNLALNPSGGNVGIGTTSPADTLHVAIDSGTTNAEVEVVRIEATSSGTPAVGFGPFIDFRGDRINGGPDSYGRLGFEADAMPSTTVNGAFIAQTAVDGTYSEKMRITSAGNVGIGTDTPDAKLEVMATRSSGANATALILHDNVTGVQTNGFGTRIEGRSNNNNAVSAIGFEAFGGTNNDTAISFYTQPTAGGLARRMIINDDGRVGIGTATPATGLHVVTAGGRTPFRVQGGANSGVNIMEVGYAGGAAGANFIVDDNGRVGIGTSSPAYKLHLSGTGIQRFEIDSTDNNANGCGVYLKVLNSGSIVSQSTITNDNAGNLKFFTGTSSETEKMFISSSGEFHIGHTQRSGFNSLGTLVVQQLGSGKGIGVVDSGANNTFQMRNESNVGIINHNLAAAQIKIGTNGTADLIVDGNTGAITKPNHPCFEAAGVSNNDTGQIAFTTTYVNVGGHYSTTTYKFTAPVAGNYLFYTNYIKNNQATSTNRRRFLKNGSTVGGGRHIRLGGENGGNYDWGSLSQIMTLAANDYVTVDQYAGNTYGSDEYDSFGGYLIG